MRPVPLISLLMVLITGCATVTPAARGPAPTVPATQPAAPPPATESPAAVAAPTATAPATRPQAARAPVARAAKPVVPPTAPAAPPLDLGALKEQLKETKAIGVLTKLSLKNQVDDLLQQFRDHYQGKVQVTLKELRRSYDLLLMKVLSLIQDADQKLASSIVASREAIWGLLSDPKKFATLEV